MTKSRWAKEDLTAHQLHIYAVKPDFMFPLGYKFRYRNYCADRVVELKSVSRSEELRETPSQLTGIEAVLHHAGIPTKIMIWVLSKRNGVYTGDGVYTLRSSIPVTNSVFGIEPADFDEKDIENLADLFKLYSVDCAITRR